MKHPFEFKGYSYEEAVKEAEETLGIPRDQLDIQRISDTRRGFLSWKQPAVHIRVQFKNENDTSSHRKKSSSERMEGKAWIEDGQIIFQPNDHQLPLCKPSDDVFVYRDGKLIEEQTVMKAGETWTVEGNKEYRKTKWSVTADSDKLQAILKVRPGCTVIKEVIDTAPSEQLHLKVKEVEHIENELTVQDIEQELRDQNISYGINQEAIESACKSDKEQRFVIAEGEPPTHGTDGTLMYQFELQPQKVAPKLLDGGTVDFRESTYIPTVQPKETIAYIIPPERGKDGTDIYGESIKANDGKPVSLQEGEGIQYIATENRIIATKAGRPHAENTGSTVHLSIVPKYEHNGHVNMESGNVQFDGDIIIHGNVEDQMKVEAAGELIVEGYATNAVVKSGHRMFINQNVINTSISAGNSNQVLAEIRDNILEEADQMSQIIQALEQLKQSPSFKDDNTNIQSLLSLLFNKKFHRFVPNIKKIIISIEKKKDVLNKEWQSLAAQLYRTFVILHKDGVKSIDDLRMLHRRMVSLQEEIQTTSSSKADVTFSYGMNSDIISNSDVHVIGKGCTHTKIRADGKVTIDRTFVGGSIYARDRIEIGTAGSRAGTKTWLEVPEDGEIRINQAMEDTIIKIGNRRFECRVETRNIYARLDKSGELLIK
ncbi:flagellar assembly protein A [Alteribacillus iranensis]|uniref:RNA-binding protein KhpB N-terminal domain-containing protein n=1 Tax=Alteribacillus iranensis TaxID=930128 RepID=A0A1I2CUP3_9BACI|nr:FapA family protein [Alteribacillus iranensis]SFE71974.1 hypothetical protein SAMN05192532_103214 [Alteribacillus iranensis]